MNEERRGEKIEKIVERWDEKRKGSKREIREREGKRLIRVKRWKKKRKKRKEGKEEKEKAKWKNDSKKITANLFSGDSAWASWAIASFDGFKLVLL